MTESNTTELAAVQAAATAIAPLSIKDTVLAQFKEAETSLTTLANRYRDVAYDTTTPKGMREAIAARADLRDNGRLFVTRAEKRIKADVNDLKRVMADEVERLVGIVKPVEESIDKQIKAEEDRKSAEKAERERVESERVEAHRANIDKLKSYVTRAEGQPIEAIEHAIEVLQAIQFGPEWEEFAGAALSARDTTVEALQKQAANEHQRLENERLVKELTEANAALEAERAANAAAAKEREDKAEQDRQTAERISREEQERADREAREKLEAEARDAQVAIAQAAQQNQIAAPVATDLSTLVTERRVEAVAGIDARQIIGAAQASAAAAPVIDPDDTITLGQINARLTPIKLDAAGIETLGFTTTKVRAAVHFPAALFPMLCRAIAKHAMEAAAAAQAEAA